MNDLNLSAGYLTDTNTNERKEGRKEGDGEIGAIPGLIMSLFPLGANSF